ncbi:hypothetical protein [Christiangramia salexigens]|uniref:Uncharacterized protein n=1 Tax=Christiangramia salexigens TaxID=1913577 RepID=A0A1L3J453_9FLAO|nr:hypothetical protein [Christiangramia salexigens]APG59896.1 hypothetical protein LPB144_05475 [Christiangramia salexigens]
MNLRNLFHLISYLQYPLMFIAFAFLVLMYNDIFKHSPLTEVLQNLNNILVFLGLAITFSTLQDTTKTQNNFSKKIYENPKKARIFLIYIGFFACIMILLGLVGFFSTQNSALEEISLGVLIFGIGLVSLLKTALELFENHRLDKIEAVRLRKI